MAGITSERMTASTMKKILIGLAASGVALFALGRSSRQPVSTRAAEEVTQVASLNGGRLESGLHLALEPRTVAGEGIELEVVGREGRSPPGLRMLSLPRVPRSVTPMHPGIAGNRGDGDEVGSPIRIAPSSFEGKDLWLGAPGYVWTRVDPDTLPPRSRLILDRGTNLAIAFATGWPEEPTTVRLKSVASDSFLQHTMTRPGPLYLDGLAAGSYELRVVAGEARSSWRLRLAEGSLDSLTLTAPGNGLGTPVVPVRGTLVLAAEDALPELVSALRLEFFPGGQNPSYEPTLSLAVEDCLALDSGAWSFQTDPLPTGPYRLALNPLGFTLDFELRAEDAWIDVQLPPLARTRVRLQGPRGNALEAPQASARLLVDRGAGQLGLGTPLWLERDSPGEFQVLSLPGQLRFESRLGALAPGSWATEVRSGANSLTCVAFPTSDLRLELHSGDGARALPIEWWSALEVEPLDGGVLVSTRFHDGDSSGPSAATLRCYGGSLFRLNLPYVAGLDLPPSVVVDVNEDHAQKPFRIEIREGNSTKDTNKCN